MTFPFVATGEALEGRPSVEVVGFRVVDGNDLDSGSAISQADSVAAGAVI